MLNLPTSVFIGPDLIHKSNLFDSFELAVRIFAIRDVSCALSYLHSPLFPNLLSLTLKSATWYLRLANFGVHYTACVFRVWCSLKLLLITVRPISPSCFEWRVVFCLQLILISIKFLRNRFSGLGQQAWHLTFCRLSPATIKLPFNTFRIGLNHDCLLLCGAWYYRGFVWVVRIFMKLQKLDSLCTRLAILVLGALTHSVYSANDFKK